MSALGIASVAPLAGCGTDGAGNNALERSSRGGFAVPTSTVAIYNVTKSHWYFFTFDSPTYDSPTKCQVYWTTDPYPVATSSSIIFDTDTWFSHLNVKTQQKTKITITYNVSTITHTLELDFETATGYFYLKSDSLDSLDGVLGSSDFKQTPGSWNEIGHQ
jgi:hypothetical protein